ncbi:MAG TPA: TolC family protein [Planctomycetota bacterium]|nr:TolC family protein [Planctomycetota bacterium]
MTLAAALLTFALQDSAPASQPIRVLDLTIDDAVDRALSFNPTLASAGLDVEATAAGIESAQGAFEPVAFAAPRFQHSETPTGTTLAGAQNLERSLVHLDTGFRQSLPTGGSYILTFQSDRERTNNSFSTLNPQAFSSFALTFTQPLLRGAWTGYGELPVARARTSLGTSSATRDLARLDVVQQVHDAYWDLVFAVANRNVARSSLQLAERLLEINRKKVEEGVIAEVEIYQAQADVATRRETLLTAENSIRATEDALKQLLFPFESREEWSFWLKPTSAPPEPGSVPIPAWQDALTVALATRPDLERDRIALRNRELDLEQRRSELLPLVNFIGSVSDSSLDGHVEFGDLWRGVFPQYSLAFAIEVPLGNMTARANLRQAETSVSSARQTLRATERQVAREVRDAVRQVAFGEEKIRASRRSREYSEKQLQAEELRFEQGLSTNFEVLTLQRDLAQAQTNQAQAVLDYAKAAVALERAKGTLRH